MAEIYALYSTRNGRVRYVGQSAGPTAATCTVAPISIAAASGCTGDMLRCSRRPFCFHHDDVPPSLEQKTRGWAAENFNFLTGIARPRHHSQVRNSPWTMFFYGVDATKKPTAAPLGTDNTCPNPFLCPQEENDPRKFFRMSRSAFSLVTSRLSRAI